MESDVALGGWSHRNCPGSECCRLKLAAIRSPRIPRNVGTKTILSIANMGLTTNLNKKCVYCESYRWRWCWSSQNRLFCGYLCSFREPSMICSFLVLMHIFLRPSLFKTAKLCSAPSGENPSFTPVQNNRQNYSFAYLNVYALNIWDRNIRNS